jgi:hypothetical protein
MRDRGETQRLRLPTGDEERHHLISDVLRGELATRLGIRACGTVSHMSFQKPCGGLTLKHQVQEIVRLRRVGEPGLDDLIAELMDVLDISVELARFPEHESRLHGQLFSADPGLNQEADHGVDEWVLEYVSARFVKRPCVGNVLTMSSR